MFARGRSTTKHLVTGMSRAVYTASTAFFGVSYDILMSYGNILNAIIGKETPPFSSYHQLCRDIQTSGWSIIELETKHDALQHSPEGMLFVDSNIEITTLHIHAYQEGEEWRYDLYHDDGQEKFCTLPNHAYPTVWCQGNEEKTQWSLQSPLMAYFKGLQSDITEVDFANSRWAPSTFRSIKNSLQKIAGRPTLSPFDVLWHYLLQTKRLVIRDDLEGTSYCFYTMDHASTQENKTFTVPHTFISKKHAEMFIRAHYQNKQTPLEKSQYNKVALGIAVLLASGAIAGLALSTKSTLPESLEPEAPSSSEDPTFNPAPEAPSSSESPFFNPTAPIEGDKANLSTPSFEPAPLPPSFPSSPSRHLLATNITTEASAIHFERLNRQDVLRFPEEVTALAEENGITYVIADSILVAVDTATFEEISRLPLSGKLNNIVVQSGNAFIVGENGLFKIDIHDPKEMSKTSETVLSRGQEAYDVALDANGYAYVTHKNPDATSGDLVSADVRGNTPQIISREIAAHPFGRIDTREDEVCVSADTQGAAIYRPDNGELGDKTSLDDPSASVTHTLCLGGGAVLVATKDNVIQTVGPTGVIASYDVGIPVSDIRVAGHYVGVVSDEKLILLEILPDYTLKEITTHTLEDKGSHVIFNGDQLLVTNGKTLGKVVEYKPSIMAVPYTYGYSGGETWEVIASPVNSKVKFSAEGSAGLAIYIEQSDGSLRLHKRLSKLGSVSHLRASVDEEGTVLLHMAAWRDGLYIIDITNIDDPKIIRQFKEVAPSTGVELSEDTIIVPAWGKGAFFIDRKTLEVKKPPNTDPGTPSVQSTHGPTAVKEWPKHRKLLLAARNSGLQSAEIDETGNAESESYLDLGGPVQDLDFVSEDPSTETPRALMILALREGGVGLVELTIGKDRKVHFELKDRLNGRFGWGVKAFSVKADGLVKTEPGTPSYAYVGHAHGAVEIIIQNGKLFINGDISFIDSVVWSVIKEGDKFWMAQSHTGTRVSVRYARHEIPRRIGFSTNNPVKKLAGTPFSLCGIETSNTVAAMTNNGHLYNLNTQTSNLETQRHHFFQKDCVAVACNGRFNFALCGNTIHTMVPSETDTTQFTQLSSHSFENGEPNAIAFMGDLACVALGKDGGLALLTLQEDGRFTPVYHVPFDGTALTVAILENRFAVVGTHVDGFKMIDCIDPANAKVVHTIPVSNVADEIVIYGKRGAAARTLGGIYTIEFDTENPQDSILKTAPTTGAIVTVATLKSDPSTIFAGDYAGSIQTVDPNRDYTLSGEVELPAGDPYSIFVTPDRLIVAFKEIGLISIRYHKERYVSLFSRKESPAQVEVPYNNQLVIVDTKEMGVVPTQLQKIQTKDVTGKLSDPRADIVQVNPHTGDVTARFPREREGNTYTLSIAFLIPEGKELTQTLTFPVISSLRLSQSPDGKLFITTPQTTLNVAVTIDIVPKLSGKLFRDVRNKGSATTSFDDAKGVLHLNGSPTDEGLNGVLAQLRYSHFAGDLSKTTFRVTIRDGKNNNVVEFFGPTIASENHRPIKKPNAALPDLNFYKGVSRTAILGGAELFEDPDEQSTDPTKELSDPFTFTITFPKGSNYGLTPINDQISGAPPALGKIEANLEACDPYELCENINLHGSSSIAPSELFFYILKIFTITVAASGTIVGIIKNRNVLVEKFRDFNADKKGAIKSRLVRTKVQLFLLFYRITCCCNREKLDRLLATIPAKSQQLLSRRFEKLTKADPETRGLLVEHAKMTEALKEEMQARKGFPLLVSGDSRERSSSGNSGAPSDSSRTPPSDNTGTSSSAPARPPGAVPAHVPQLSIFAAAAPANLLPEDGYTSKEAEEALAKQAATGQEHLAFC
jgi:hypothetical protein